MKIKQLIYILSTFLLLSCSRMVKNPDAKVEDEINLENTVKVVNKASNITPSIIMKDCDDLLGFWVGYFYKAGDLPEHVNVYGDEGLAWFRENKINISIDFISAENKVTGHSVVAGNNRPFEGSMKENKDAFVFEVVEPGDDKYDGKFSFTIAKNDSTMKGTWKAYNKIEISQREYELKKKIYEYDRNQMLSNERHFGDWNRAKRITISDEEEKEIFGDYYEEFASASLKIYEINASAKLLTKEEVENLKKGDLLVIRNTIYARHGYSFKNRPLRVFFDAQPWYIPVHTDIKSELTSIEKQNIKLLLRYEKNAEEYYDSFGRG
jgi:hypothetical protein